MNGKLQVPLLVGSGVTKDNLNDYYPHIQAAIIGSHFKLEGKWQNDLDETAISEFMIKVEKLKS